jgi:hypothetical protein
MSGIVDGSLRLARRKPQKTSSTTPAASGLVRQHDQGREDGRLESGDFIHPRIFTRCAHATGASVNSFFEAQ